VLLAGPSSQTMSVAMFDQWANGASGEVSAMGIVWSAVMTAFTLGLYLVTRKRGDMLAGRHDDGGKRRWPLGHRPGQEL